MEDKTIAEYESPEIPEQVADSPEGLGAMALEGIDDPTLKNLVIKVQKLEAKRRMAGFNPNIDTATFIFGGVNQSLDRDALKTVISNLTPWELPEAQEWTKYPDPSTDIF